MRKAKKLVLLSLMVFLLSSLSACGTDNKNPDDMAQEETQNGTETGARQQHRRKQHDRRQQ